MGNVNLRSTQEALRARVTGKTAGGRTPPPAQPIGKPPAAQSIKPLRPGGVPAAALTPLERQAMAQVSWQDGDPIPAEMADIFAKTQAEVNETRPEYAADRPALQVDTKEIDELSPEQRAEVQRKMRETLKLHEDAKHRRAEEMRRGVNMKTSVAAAITDIEQMADQTIEVVDDRKSPPKVAPSAPVPLAAVAAPVSDTGAVVEPTHCQHCGFDLRVTDIPEPSYAEKLTFLAAWEGEIPYLKTYDLFGGSTKVTFRTLTTAELEAVYKQASYEARRAGVDALEQFELTPRYRLCLQLRRLQSSQYDHELPDGLDALTSPHAQNYYEIDQESITEGATALPVVADYLRANVLKTENMWRVVSRLMHEFNRLVSKLEVMVPVSDFWKPTAKPG